LIVEGFQHTARGVVGSASRAGWTMSDHIEQCGHVDWRLTGRLSGMLPGKWSVITSLTCRRRQVPTRAAHCDTAASRRRTQFPLNHQQRGPPWYLAVVVRYI